MVVQSNASALNTCRQFNNISSNYAKDVERVSSGYKINRAADDAAGLTISEVMRRQVRGLTQASKNAQDGISLVQIADGALEGTHSILQRLNELSVKSANGTNTDADREAIQTEVDALVDEIDRIAEYTAYNTLKLLDGTMSGSDRLIKGSAAVPAVPSKAENLSGGSLYYKASAGGYSAISGNSQLATKIDEGETIYKNGNPSVSSSATIKDLKVSNVSKLQSYFDAKGLKDGAIVNLTYTASGGKYQWICSADGKSVSGAATKNENSALTSLRSNTGITYTVSGSMAAGTVISVNVGGYMEAESGKDYSYTKGSDAIDPVPDRTESTAGLILQVGAEGDRTNCIELRIAAIDSKSLEIDDLDVTTQDSACESIDRVNSAIAKCSNLRSDLGAYQNRLEYSIFNLDNVVENTQAAESGIRDADIADEMIKLTKDAIQQWPVHSMFRRSIYSNSAVLALLA